MKMNIDLETEPNLHFRIDLFSVPNEAREAFEEAMRRNMTFIKTLRGFLGHVAFEKVAGPTSFNLVTIAKWETQEALVEAGREVRAYYERIGFDMAASLAQWGVRAELGNFHAPPGLQ